MPGRMRVVSLFILMVTSCVFTAGISIWFLYQTALQEERERLTETATSQARLIEAVARFDKRYSSDYAGGAVAATMVQVRDAHANYNGLGETGEFTLARKEGNTIVFLLSHRHYDLEKPKPVDFDSELAEPMRQALSGNSGTLIGLDYRGKQVLAAYEPVRGLGLGIVAKIDMVEIRAPFIRVQVITIFAIAVILLLGSVAFYKISSPILKSLTRQNEQLVDEIKQHRATEANLVKVESLLKSILKSMPLPLVYTNRKGRAIGFSKSFEAFFAQGHEDLMDTTVFDLYSEESAALHHEMEMKLLREGGREVYETSVADGQGRERDIVVHKTTYNDSEGNISGLISAFVDITEEKQLTAELRRGERLLNEMGSIAKIGGWEHDLVNRTATWTREVYRIVELDESASIPGPDEQFDYYPEDDRTMLFEKYHRAMETGEGFDLELQCRTAGGKVFWARIIGQPEFEDGTCVKMRGTFQDVTEQKAWEERLRQSQKMEAVGNLAGGVAHDYNNMLTIITGFTELALEKVSPQDSLYDDLQEIEDAAHRSVEITRQLLAFSRQQNIQPQILDLNITIENMLKMLQRLIGEDIDLAWLPGEELPPVLLDPVQVDQILANLCVNARDAIEGTGKVTIETRRSIFDDEYCANHPGSVPGDYVMLGVSDDGRGMEAAVHDKIFEPFFTTKKLGKGTGLGLATVYGIVKQNEGFINVYSEPGRGTTFKVYLPQHLSGKAVVAAEEDAELPLGHGEVILLVEDETHILKLGKRVLEGLGYRVLAAGKPSKALALSEKNKTRLDLLLTDVIMPEMNGRELSERMQHICPGLKTLYMSGYTANVIAHRGVLEKGVCFMPKPFSRKDIAVHVRQALGSS